MDTLEMDAISRVIVLNPFHHSFTFLKDFWQGGMVSLPPLPLQTPPTMKQTNLSILSAKEFHNLIMSFV
jgi:hypothetical protein